MSESVKKRDALAATSEDFPTTRKVRASSQTHEGEIFSRTPLQKKKPNQTPYPIIAASNEIPGLKEAA
jgi:hypothetical protein